MILERWKEVDGTIGALRFGDFTHSLTPKLIAQLRSIEAIGNTKSASSISRSVNWCALWMARSARSVHALKDSTLRSHSV
jgi:hypothetical protein